MSSRVFAASRGWVGFSSVDSVAESGAAFRGFRGKSCETRDFSGGGSGGGLPFGVIEKLGIKDSGKKKKTKKKKTGGAVASPSGLRWGPSGAVAKV
jgi:hypothetical protein